jgi:hypothetical protein
MTRALLPLLALAASAAADSATIRIPAPFSIDDASSVTVVPAGAAPSPGVTAFGFTAQQSGVARASYAAEDAGDSFRWRMVMTVDGRVRNETEYHTTMTVEQVCGLVTVDADGEAAKGARVFLDPCTMTANQTSGVGEDKTTESVSTVMSYGIAGLVGMAKAKQSQLLLDTVTVAGGKFVDAAVTAGSSESSSRALDDADRTDLSTTADLAPTAAETDAPQPTKPGKDKNATTTAPPKPSNQKSAGSSVAAMVVPALLGLGLVLAL